MYWIVLSFTAFFMSQSIWLGSGWLKAEYETTMTSPDDATASEGTGGVPPTAREGTGGVPPTAREGTGGVPPTM